LNLPTLEHHQFLPRRSGHSGQDAWRIAGRRRAARVCGICDHKRGYRDCLFSHLALSEAGEQGQGTAWGTHVSDAEYNEAASVG